MNILNENNIDWQKYLTEEDRIRINVASAYAPYVKHSFLGMDEKQGCWMPWRKAIDFRFRPGELTIWSGYNGHKKSMVLGQVSLGLLAQEQDVCIASPEMPVVNTLKRMIRQFVGVSEPTAPYQERFFKFCNGRLWMYDQIGTIDSRKMIAVAHYIVKDLNIDHLVIDSLMKMGIPEDDLNKQKWFCDHLATLAKDTGAHIHLVAHSKKPFHEETTPSTKYGVAGSANITNLADNVIVVFENKKEDRNYDNMLIVEKQRNADTDNPEPKYMFWFDANSLQLKPSEQAYRMSPDEWERRQWN